MAHRFPLLELPLELLGLVARALLCDDPQADAQAVGRLAASSKALRELVSGSAAVVAELQAARKMLTLQRQHELFVATGDLRADAAFPFDPSNYKQVAQQLPAPATTLNLKWCVVVPSPRRGSKWRVAPNLDPQFSLERCRLAARLLRVSSSLVTLDLYANLIGDESAKALAAGVAASGSLVTLNLGVNQIGDEGAEAIAEAVRVSGSMDYLNLKYKSRIGDAAKHRCGMRFGTARGSR